MAIKDIERQLDRFGAKVDRALHMVDKVTAEKFITKARQQDTYKDDTANLRNSIGYSAISPEEKSQNANSDAADAISDINIDQGLIMVAGMNYAAAVEAKGYDVITDSVIWAEGEHENLRRKVLKRLIK